jgi:tetratricopeptide (TPR) repeat protein
VRPLILIVTLLFPLVTLAADPKPAADGKDEARGLFSKANKAYKQGKYAEALKLYRQAGKIFPSYKIQLNIGETLESMGRNTEAAVTYHRFLRKFKGAPRPARRDAWLRLDGMRRWLGRVKLIVSKQGAKVTVDGNDAGQTPLDLPLYLQPGKHTIKVEMDGFLSATRAVRLRRGGHRKLRVRLKRKVELPTTPPAEACPKVTCPSCDDAPDALRQAHRNMTIGGYVALGTGLALVAGAAVLYGVGGAQGAEAYDLYKEAKDPANMARHYDDVQDSRSMLMAGHGLMAGGVVALGLSVYQFLARPDLPGDSQVSLAPLTGGAALTVGGRF